MQAKKWKLILQRLDDRGWIEWFFIYLFRKQFVFFGFSLQLDLLKVVWVRQPIKFLEDSAIAFQDFSVDF